MGKKSKTGKSRKDKFYRLAKETGYRARSAFKLIQLNRKFEFLQKSRVVIDLCAAPGGWLQVVAENTPVSSLIVGVDLVSIRPIQNVTTLQEDITTDKCRQSLRKELQTWKADCVLNDGAPNVGKNWIHDAFQQAQLTLQALKLATEFLRKGGWFVTKVFRSKDYNALMWVFQQLFKRVHATKPQASRNESAEIFVVCEKYIAPDRLDPKFLDPKHVFKEISEEPKQQINLIHPEKKQRQRDGYAEGDYTLHHTLKATDFMTSDNHLTLLAGASEVVLDDPRIVSHRDTTTEIKECLKDIKVLGKKDIKLILNWRKKLKKDLFTDETKKKKEDSPSVEQVEEDSEDEQAQIEEKLAEVKEEERKALKRKQKKVRKEKIKLQHKMDLKMVIPGDRLDLADDVGLFNLNKIKNKAQLNDVESGDTRFADEYAAENLIQENGLTRSQKMVTYDRDTKDYLDREDYTSDEEGEEEPDLEDISDQEQSDEDIGSEEEADNPLVVSLEPKPTLTNRKMNSWFSKDAFAGLEDDLDEDIEIEEMILDYKNKGGSITEGVKKDKKSQKSKQNSKMEEKDSGLSDSDSESNDNSDSVSDTGSDSDYDESEFINREKLQKSKKSKIKSGDFEVVPADGPKLGPEGLAIGAAMVQSRKRKRDIIDDAYNRYMFNDEGLPDWFVKDEAKHQKRELPVTKAEIAEYKDKMKSINARPIKKIAEAKSRKKRKEMKKLERVRKKAENISDTTDISEREKWQQIKNVYKKAGLLSQKKKEITYVVAKKGTGKRVRRPQGVQGPFKVVDPRMKKDNKHQKKTQKQAKGKKQPKGRKGRQKT